MHEANLKERVKIEQKNENLLKRKTAIAIEYDSNIIKSSKM